MIDIYEKKISFLLCRTSLMCPTHQVVDLVYLILYREQWLGKSHWFNKLVSHVVTFSNGTFTKLYDLSRKFSILNCHYYKVVTQCGKYGRFLPFWHIGTQKKQMMGLPNLPNFSNHCLKRSIIMRNKHRDFTNLLV